MSWIDLKDKKPKFEKGSSYSDRLIVGNSEKVVDNVRCYRFKEWNGEYKYAFMFHAFGYDNDSYEVENVTHWQLLPKPPKK